MSDAPIIHPVILSGGAGTRLWPLSRQAFPKQLLSFFGEESLLQQTCRRVSGPLFGAPLVVAGDEHRFLIAEQLRGLDLEVERLILEPAGRNTAPAVLVAALWHAQRDPDALNLVLPSDHIIRDEAAFESVLRIAAPAAAGGQMVTFGITPDRAETGYGYLELAKAPGAGKVQVLPLVGFVEKPSQEKAKAFLDSGRYLWNGGIFLFRARDMIEAFERHAPQFMAPCREALEKANQDLDFLRLDADAYSGLESLSLDYAIMEKVEKVATVPFSGGWSDLGSWAALWQESRKDGAGNALEGDAHALNCRNSLILAGEGAPLVIGEGLEDMVAVATRDAVFISKLARSQGVKEVVTALKQAGRDEADTHRRTYRPWGWYETLDLAERFQVKRIVVKPGGKLSLQSHFHRSEHWIVVHGTATVTLDDNVSLVSENESVYVRVGQRHRLENEGKVELHLIEVQTGSYLGEDDIQRYDDVYKRD